MKSILSPLFSLFLLSSLSSLSSLFVVFSSTQASAQPEKMVVTGQRVPKLAGTSVITSDDLEKYPGMFLDDILRDASGLDLIRTGGPGGQTSLSIRGSMNDQIQVLIDGMPVSDPTLIGGGFSFDHLSVDGIDRIEITRGPHSVEFGSGALAGVINIVTKKQKAKNGVGIAYDSYKTRDGRLNFHGNGKHWWLNAGGSSTVSPGISQAAGQAEADSYKRSVTNITLGWDAETMHAWLNRRISWSELDLDAYDANNQFTDDPNYKTKGRHELSRASVNTTLLNKRWDLTIMGNRSYTERNYDNPSDSINPTTEASRYEGVVNSSSVDNKIKLGRIATLGLGLQKTTERAQIANNFSGFESGLEKTDDATGFYGSATVKPVDLITISAAARRDAFADFSSVSSDSLQLAYQSPIGDFFILSGKAFKAPSLFQRFSSFGNPDLKVQRSDSAELGYKIHTDSVGSIELEIFQQYYRSLIDFQNGTYTNASGLVEAKGGEFEWSQNFTDLAAHLGASYTDIHNKQDQKQLAGKPRAKGSASADYRIDSVTQTLGYNYTAERRQPSADPLPSYGLWRYNLSYLWGDTCRTQFAISNLMNKHYTEAGGYGTMGRGIEVDVSAEF